MPTLRPILAALADAVRLPRAGALAPDVRTRTRAHVAALCAAVTLAAAAVGVAVVVFADGSGAASVGALRVAAVVVDCLLVAGVEEMLFRGVIFGGAVNALLQSGRSTDRALLLAALAQALFFGLLHLSGTWPEALTGIMVCQAVAKVVAATAFGFIMAVLYALTRSLWVPIAVHAAYDLLSLLPQQLLAGPEGITTYLTGVPADAAIMAATAAVLVTIALFAAGALRAFSR